MVGEAGHYLNLRSTSERRSKLVESLRKERNRLDDLALVFSSVAAQNRPAAC